jgi:hypothetical protein
MIHEAVREWDGIGWRNLFLFSLLCLMIRITKNQNLLKNRKTQPDSEFQKVDGVGLLMCDGVEMGV